MRQKKIKTCHSMRNGLTLMELSLSLVIVGVVFVSGLFAFNKLYAPTVANSEFGRVTQLIGAIERARGDNMGAYPALAAATDVAATANPISNQMGGIASATDLLGWTYGCAAGTSSTVTLTTAAFSTSTVADLVRTKTASAFPQWVADASGTSSVTFTLSGIACK
ncbi:MAG: hypothetical protein A3F91_09265 [Flavobacteria bacterium RIFCSPLOWO2_12_FULL_35_11]|nr:MAG: hypothetical protein A3F91_09265 [Flavobacteria bacterium RIFCSPLOWO2_12_FULL_35_11]